jgi:hypothetical protein
MNPPAADVIVPFKVQVVAEGVGVLGAVDEPPHAARPHPRVSVRSARIVISTSGAGRERCGLSRARGRR